MGKSEIGAWRAFARPIGGRACALTFRVRPGCVWAESPISMEKEDALKISVRARARFGFLARGLPDAALLRRLERLGNALTLALAIIFLFGLFFAGVAGAYGGLWLLVIPGVGARFCSDWADRCRDAAAAL